MQGGLLGSKLALVPHVMDDGSWLDVNCGRCGRALVMAIDALRSPHTVECADCVGESDGGGEPVPLRLFRLSRERRLEEERAAGTGPNLTLLSHNAF